MDMKKAIVIAGATATGKTGASIMLAKLLGGEIVSADSIQVYKYMDIGAAKATKEEQAQAVHHMIDVVDPKEDYSVALFRQQAARCIEDIQSRGRLPIIVGGTGLYINSLVYPMDFSNTAKNPEYRAYLEQYLESRGVHALHELLKSHDADTALRIHENNTKRVIRALEIIKETGAPPGSYTAFKESQPPRQDYALIQLCVPRESLNIRIGERIDEMVSMGLKAEVEFLLDYGCARNSTAMLGLTYRQMAMHLCGEISFDGAIELMKRETRRFAKRQNTWFKREPMIPIDVLEYASIESMCLDIISKTGLNAV